MVTQGTSGDLQLLIELGKKLDLHTCRGESVRSFLVRSLLKIRDREGNLVELHPNRAQTAYEGHCRGRNIVVKARQVGITTWIAARFFISTITQPGTLSVQVAHNQDSAEEIFRIVHRFLENLPGSLRQGALMTSRANVGQLVFPGLDSEYRVETAADPNAGRGLTIRNLHCSEVARWPRDATATLASLRAAVVPQGEVVLESTPSGAGGCFYQEWQNAAEAGYQQHFFPWWWEKQYVAQAGGVGDLTDEERDLVARRRLSPEQIAFRRQMRADFRGLAPQEFAEDAVSCFLASGECVFDLQVVERRLAEVEAPLPGTGIAAWAAETRDNGRLLIWWPPRPGHEYIMGVDPAGGGSTGDFACAQVIERISGMQCAELQAHYGPREMAAHIAELGHEYNDALIAVERNNHGFGVLAHLGEKYAEIYEQNRQAGWLTTAANRPRVIELLAATLATEPGLFSSARLLEECRSFVRRADGSAAAAAGAHDDCIMAMAIALAVRNETCGRVRRRKEMELASIGRSS